MSMLRGPCACATVVDTPVRQTALTQLAPAGLAAAGVALAVAVAVGAIAVPDLAGTRRIISAAGAIMIAVFLGFATDPDPVIKMTGIGLASAVLVDVTLVRLFMAPAALTLLGDRLWPGGRRTAPSTPAAAIATAGTASRRPGG